MLLLCMSGGGMKVLNQYPKTLVALAQATYYFGTYFLEVWHDLRLGYVRLFPTKINVIFGISASNIAGITKIYAEKKVALHSLTFTK